MSSLNKKSRADFDEWLASIGDWDLVEFVFSNRNDEVSFGSEDFKLVYCGLSTGEPVGCHMIEARIRGQTKNRQLQRLSKTSASLIIDPTRLAFALFQPSIGCYEVGAYIRRALQESPVNGPSILNKIHLHWSSDVKIVDGKVVDGQACVHIDDMPLVSTKIPVSGFNVDGSKVAKRERTKK